MIILELLNVVILVPDPCLFLLLLFCFVFAAEYICLMSSFKYIYIIISLVYTLLHI